MATSARPGARRRSDFFDRYTRDLTRDEVSRLFTHDTRDAYRYFSHGVDRAEIAIAPLVEARAGPASFGVPRVHAEAVTRTAAALRGEPALRAARPGAALHGHWRRLGGRRAHQRAGPRADVAAGHVAAHRLVRAPQPARAARGGRPVVPQERPRDRARHPARDAASRHVPRARRRDLRPDQAGEHGGRRLLRDLPAAGRARDHRARRRGGQGQPGRPADGAAAGDHAHAAGRGPRPGLVDDAPQPADRADTRRARASSRCSSASSSRATGRSSG